MGEAQKTPLTDLLRGVPPSHRTEWESQWAENGRPTGHTMCPVGKLMHEAADRIAELEAENERLREFAIWMTGCGYDFAQHQFYLDRQHLLTEGAND